MKTRHWQGWWSKVHRPHTRDPPISVLEGAISNLWFSVIFLIWQNNWFSVHFEAKSGFGWLNLHSAPISLWGTYDNKFTLLVPFRWNVGWFLCFGASHFFIMVQIEQKMVFFPSSADFIHSLTQTVYQDKAENIWSQADNTFAPDQTFIFLRIK